MSFVMKVKHNDPVFETPTGAAIDFVTLDADHLALRSRSSTDKIFSILNIDIFFISSPSNETSSVQTGANVLTMRTAKVSLI